MAQGRHLHRRRTRALAVIAIVAGVAVLVAGGIAFAAYRYERSRADRILPGVTITGIDVGGMTRAEAVRAVRVEASAHLDGSITVRAAGKTWSVTRREFGQRANIDGAVSRALALNGTMGTFSRFWHRFRDEAVGKDLTLRYTSARRLDGFVVDAAKAVATDPIDAAITLRDGDVVMQKSKPGRSLDAGAASATLRAALAAGSPSVVLQTQKVSPKVTSANLGPTVVVRVDENKLYLYDGFQVERTWSVATAKPGYTTPVGDWVVTRKAVNPTWYNPALDSWGADLPAVVPGGPTAPMGTRAIYIDDAPGLIRIHGTPSDDSIGRYASHGCIRMHNSEVEVLYPLVPVGTHVLIVGYRPSWAQEWDTPAASDI
ncbi:MAG: L,D-transpeptidase/peptidoglycan binding protein [Actinomycetota bacterium]